MVQAQDQPGTRCGLNCLFITVPHGTRALRYPAFAIGLLEAVGLLPGVIAAAVVVQETDYEHDICLLETVARCKIECPSTGIYGDAWEELGGTLEVRHTRIGISHIFIDIHAVPYHMAPLWFVDHDSPLSKPLLHVVMNAEGLWGNWARRRPICGKEGVAIARRANDFVRGLDRWVMEQI
jgi:hypothetical protein